MRAPCVFAPLRDRIATRSPRVRNSSPIGAPALVSSHWKDTEHCRLSMGFIRTSRTETSDRSDGNNLCSQSSRFIRSRLCRPGCGSGLYDAKDCHDLIGNAPSSRHLDNQNSVRRASMAPALRATDREFGVFDVADELGRRQAADQCMGPSQIVVDAAALDRGVRMEDRGGVLVEQFVAKAAVEALDASVCIRRRGSMKCSSTSACAAHSSVASPNRFRT